MLKRFEVWAPDASAVELVLGSTRSVPMQGEKDGWWSAGVEHPVSDYGFVVDGAGPFPDPRSR